LGVLAAALGNGEIQLFSVPHPESLKKDSDNVTVINLAPILRTSRSSSQVPLVMDWGCVSTNEEMIAVGYDSGK